jgi:predicted dehydrogenase
MNVLVVGLGGIGQRHARNLRATLGADVEILGCDPRRDIPVLSDRLQIEPGDTLERKLGLRMFSDLELALGQQPRAVFVCNPTSQHVPVALRAARAGCALFIEKPLSHEYAQVDELIALVEGRRLNAAVGYQMRFHPCLRRLRALIQEKRVGRIVSVRAEVGEYLPGWHTYEDYRQSYAARRDLGGGVILTQIHELDYLCWLFGLPRSVYAVGGHLSGLEIDVEDTAEILMDCVVDQRSVPVSVHQDYLQRPAHRTCEVIGDQGRILADLAALSVVVSDGEGREVEAASYAGFQRNQMFLDELSLFLSSLQEPSIAALPAGHEGVGACPLVSVREAAQSLSVALAARESLANGRVVECTT